MHVWQSGQGRWRECAGEEQKQLDVIANDIFLAVNAQAGHYPAMASEELEDVYGGGWRGRGQVSAAV